MNILGRIRNRVRYYVDTVSNDIRFNSNRSKRESVKIILQWEAIDYILKTGCSLSRYGDGEFGVILGRNDPDKRNNVGFQECTPDLSQALEDVLREGGSRECNHMVGLPACMFGRGTSYLLTPAARFWKAASNRLLDPIMSMLDKDKVYIDSMLSRFYLTRKDKSDCRAYAEHLKKLWNGRNVLIVEGRQTCLGVGNDLFDNALSVKRIIAPQTDAFSKRKELFDAVCATLNADMYKEHKPLVLMALGMTATVLARDLAPFCQALDMGHFDIEYEWMKMGATEKVPIPGKFVNEADGGKNVQSNDDKGYHKQIIAVVD